MLSMAKETNKINPYLLALIAVALLSAAWLMKSFPILIFAGLAPLFAITDYAQKENSWNKLETVGVALAISWWAGWMFAPTQIVASLVIAIALTLLFVIYAFTLQSLGQRLGKLPLILFWLALEYVVLKVKLGNEVLFLADSLQLKTSWYQWTGETGYLGLSLWILLANLMLYHGILQKGVQPIFLVAFGVIVVTPIIYSLVLTNAEPITRTVMTSFYETNEISVPGVYSERGEWISRTATWISVLIVLYAAVKRNTSKK